MGLLAGADSKCLRTKARMASRKRGLMQPHRSKLCNALCTGPMPRSVLTSRTRLGRLGPPSRNNKASKTCRERALSIVSLEPKATRPALAWINVYKRSGVTKRLSVLSPTVRPNPVARKEEKSINRIFDSVACLDASASSTSSMNR